MSKQLRQSVEPAVEEAARWLKEAVDAKKCWSCGCLHSSLEAIDRALEEDQLPAMLGQVLEQSRSRLREVRYDCLGCQICYPPLAMNALGRTALGRALEAEACPTDEVEERVGWPPLPGSYTVLRYGAPVAVCTLTDEVLSRTLAREKPTEVALIGTMQTENLGIERLVRNILANPNSRFVVVCGEDSRQAIGHLPGQSLVALAREGLDERGRIVGARGKRPLLRNISPDAIERFRQTVEVVDLVGCSDHATITATIAECAARYPGPAEPFASERLCEHVTGYLPKRMVLDPAGYFVVYPDRARNLLLLEHYTKDGILDTVIEGKTSAELYVPAVERKLLTRLDHSAYLGRELARAEQALRSGTGYTQDAAPESRFLSVLPVHGRGRT